MQMTRFSRNASLDRGEGRVVDGGGEVDSGDQRAQRLPASRSTTTPSTGRREPTVLVIESPPGASGSFGYDIKMAPGTLPGTVADRVARIPPIVDLDDHVVEPPDDLDRPPAREVPRPSARTS